VSSVLRPSPRHPSGLPGAWGHRVGLRGRIASGEGLILLVAVGLGLGVRVTYVLATRHLPLAGDELEYDAEGWLIAHGHLFWTRLPYGVLHAGAWKPPGYPAWVGLLYALGGHHPLIVRLVQVPLGALTIGLAWLLARRLFSPRVAGAAAVAVALYPLAFQYEELLYAEALATPLTLLILLVALSRPPTRWRSVLCGGLLGIILLIRPSCAYLLLALLAAWIVSGGWRRGLGLTAIAALVAALVVAPWTVRNELVLHGFLPIALDDAAGYGTFNAQSAHDRSFPYAWRPDPPSAGAVLHPRRPLSDMVLHARLTRLTLSYIEAHPQAVPAAFFWNGLSRLWDVRRRSRALAEVPFEGRSPTLARLGLDAYYLFLPLALLGLWRLRRRRALLAGLTAMALGASLVYTADSGTRYRATLEPVIAVLACVGVLGGGVAHRADAPGDLRA